MKCPTCGFEYHLRRRCTQGKGTRETRKCGKEKGSSSGLPGVLYAQQMSGELSDVPTVPPGIRPV
eukprot:1651326-Prorocentrum_lima.AAC.1